jgi:ubiquitin-like protein Pup
MPMPQRSQSSQEGRPQEPTSVDQDTSSAVPGSENSSRIINDLDAILDQIDEVLEENADEFVKNYVQKGGE